MKLVLLQGSFWGKILFKFNWYQLFKAGFRVLGLGMASEVMWVLGQVNLLVNANFN